MKNIRKWVWLVLSAGVVWFFSAIPEVNPGLPSKSSLPRAGRGEPKTETFAQMERILLVLESVQTPYRLMEERYPSSAEELLHSPYLAVLLQDLLNPYTGKPVEVVSGIWKDKKEFLEYLKGNSPPPEIPPTHLGNLAFTDYDSRRYLVELYTEPFLFRDEVRISLYFFLWKGKINKENFSYGERRMLEHYKRVIGPEFFTLMNDTDKRVFSICWYLSQFTSTLQSPLDHFITLEELQKIGPRLYKDIKNPYTNLPVKEVSYFNPSPGDFTLVFVQNSYDNTYLTPDLICYFEGGRYVHHANISIEDPAQEEKLGYKIIFH